MIIKSLNGRVICETDHKTIRGAVEYCAENGISLEKADLRRARLVRGNLDGLIAPGACFWGADLEGADIGYADMSGTDLRGASLKDACLCGTDLRDSDLRGAYFSGTLLEDTLITGMTASCPSLWQCNLRDAASFTHFTYLHKGEEALRVIDVPTIIEGAGPRMVLLGNRVLYGAALHSMSDFPQGLQKALFALRVAEQRAALSAPFENAKDPYPQDRNARQGF